MKLLSLLDRFFRINKGYGDINDMQLAVMHLVDHWVRTKKKPVPQSYLMMEMTKNGTVKARTAKESIRVLVHKGYLRKAIVMSSKTFYVQLRFV